ncbi:hypothetical protein PSCICO_47370 [Pseudomonas cichorii]|uniref:hypothetical protein n=1 Tax=Pseudomonas cichorii TaxID=36746 RepID=UPI00191063FD|nr:hypothetical protein [Pseudomonas cichorii]GFM89338.1 hypothetical protein PSCICO_47370 [Pseudomonas cichorii]
MEAIKDPFPGHGDAGKALDWISRQISETALEKDLVSKIQVQGDAQNDSGQSNCRQAKQL